jgi:hypothetical protein
MTSWWPWWRREKRWRPDGKRALQRRCRKEGFSVDALLLHRLAAKIYLAAFFFCNSQRRRTASAILFRPSGERLRFFLRLTGVSALTESDFVLRVFLVAGPASPASKVRACSRREISRSISARIFESCIRDKTGRVIQGLLKNYRFQGCNAHWKVAHNNVIAIRRPRI